MRETKLRLESVAIKCAELDKMLEFYTRAFGGEFKAVDIGGMTCHFGQVAGLTFKLVPGRESTEFKEYPHHQLGFEVDDIDAVITIAKECGGTLESEKVTQGDVTTGSVRDPDGNTLELSQRVVVLNV